MTDDDIELRDDFDDDAEDGEGEPPDVYDDPVIEEEEPA